MPAPAEITPTRRDRPIGTPVAPLLADMRRDEDRLARHAAGRRAVVYCRTGLKISRGIGALLGDRGMVAATLAVGCMGQADTRTGVVERPA